MGTIKARATVKIKMPEQQPDTISAAATIELKSGTKLTKAKKEALTKLCHGFGEQAQRILEGGGRSTRPRTTTPKQQEESP